MPGRILGRIKERVRNLSLQKAKQPLQRVKEGRIHQQLDHFDRLDVSTFPQVEKDQWSLCRASLYIYI